MNIKIVTSQKITFSRGMSSKKSLANFREVNVLIITLRGVGGVGTQSSPLWGGGDQGFAAIDRNFEVHPPPKVCLTPSLRSNIPLLSEINHF